MKEINNKDMPLSLETMKHKNLLRNVYIIKMSFYK